MIPSQLLTEKKRQILMLSNNSERVNLETIYKRCTVGFYNCMLFLDNSKDVARLGFTNKLMNAAVFGEGAMCWYQQVHGIGKLKVNHNSENVVNLHGLVPMSIVKTYIESFRLSNPKIVPFKGLNFQSAEEIEAAGVTWLEICNLADDDAKSFVAEFAYRRETLDRFFADPELVITSSIVKVEYETENEFGDPQWDIIKFKLKLRPEKTHDGDVSLLQHRLSVQLVGGKSASQIYQVSLHSVHPKYQIHVQVEDHRMPIVETKETFHKYHALMDSLNNEMKVRMLIRVKPDGNGPLGEMCGCC